MQSLAVEPARPREDLGTVSVGRGAPRPASHRHSWPAPDSPLLPAVHRLERSPGRRHASIRIACILDVVGASVGLLVAAPVLIVVAASIRVSSRGPVLLRHERLGRDFEPFHCLKFHTMHRDSERIIEELRRHLRVVLSVRPGMTGPWQVGGRNKIDYPELVDIDVDYVYRKSTTIDLPILLKTPAVLLDWDATS